MRALLAGMIATGTLAAQTVGGPVTGYVMDGTSRIRPLHGLPSAAHVGQPILDGAKDSWSDLVLLKDGRAIHRGKELEGRWESLQPNALLDATGREVLIVGNSVPPWRLALPERALAVRVSVSGEKVLTLLADESLASWSVGGNAGFRLQDRGWWSFCFAGERAVAYDPAAHSLLSLDSGGVAAVIRELRTEARRYSLAVDRSGRFAILLGASALIVPLDGSPVREIAVPENSDRLEPVQDGGAFLLTRDPSLPLWVLDPSREQPLLVIPAIQTEPSVSGGSR